MIAHLLLGLGVVAVALLAFYVWKKDAVDAWIAKVRGSKAAQTAIAAESTIAAALERLHELKPDPAVPATDTAASPVTVAPNTPPVAAPSGDGGTDQPAAEAAEPEKENAMNDGTGSIPVATMWKNGLPTHDMMFLLQVMQAFPGNGNLPEHVLHGTQAQILEVKQYLHNTGQEPLLDLRFHDQMTGFTGPLRDAVKPIVKATIDARTNPYSRHIYQGYFDKYLA